MNKVCKYSRLTLLVFLFLLAACKKTEIPFPAAAEETAESAARPGSGGGTAGFTITTGSVYVGSMVSVIANGTIGSSGGGSGVSERGFCYSTGTGPTIANDTARAGSGAGTFQDIITGLTPGTRYYIRAYGIKSGIAYYGNEVSFTTLTMGYPSAGVGTVYDVDGNVYNTVTLGTQVWMLENLKTTRYRDGTPISYIPATADWMAAVSGAYCNYNNDPANDEAYGKMYNLFAVKDARNLAPAGWHIPDNNEWRTLLDFLGGADTAGGRMKETGNTHWLSPNFAADNSSLFTARGGGYRDINYAFQGDYRDLQKKASYWSSYSHFRSDGSTYISAYYLFNDRANAGQTTGANTAAAANYGFYVRCIKD